MEHLPVVRTYAASTRAEAERAYTLDMAGAAGSGWRPVAHRWRNAEPGHELCVVFETDGPAAGVSGWTATAPDTWVGSSTPAARAHSRTTMEAIDLHCAGEPLRLVRSGYPQVPHLPVLERREWVREHADAARRSLIYEPRGHRDMYAAVLLAPYSGEADICVLFMHNEGYSTMCGHGIIAVATVAVETGFVAATGGETALAIDTPAGLVRARVLRPPGEPASVAFVNVPSFVAVRDATVDVAGVGGVRYDLAFGGAFYAYVEAAALGLQLVPEEHQRIIDLGMAIKRAVATATPPRHPDTDDLGFVYGTIFVGRALTPAAHSRNVCVFANGQVDRSPTGTGVSGRAAIHHARGELSPGVPLVIESLVGSRFEVRIVERTRVGPHEAVVPEVRGSASITGVHRFVVDPADTLPRGVFLG